MMQKLPKALIDELDGLMKQLRHGNAEERGVAMSRLTTYEQSGKISLPLLIEMADERDVSISMYAITALGRNGHPDAVKKLSAMAATLREGNPLVLETVVDALGDTRSKEATPALLDLLGIGSNWTSRLFGRLTRKKEEQQAKQERMRKQMMLPVARALEKIGDPRAVEATAFMFDHEDALVRCHAIRAAIQAGFTRSLERIKQLAEKDKNETVRELARIALGKLGSAPLSELNN